MTVRKDSTISGPPTTISALQRGEKKQPGAVETAGADTNNRASSLKWKYRLDIWLQILKETKKRSNAFLLFMFSVLRPLAVDFFFRWQTGTAWNAGKCSAKAVGSEILHVACAARKHGALHHGRQAFHSSRLHHVSISMWTNAASQSCKLEEHRNKHGRGCLGLFESCGQKNQTFFPQGNSKASVTKYRYF